MLDVVAAGEKKPVRALGEEALVLAAGGEALVVVVGKALCSKACCSDGWGEPPLWSRAERVALTSRGVHLG